MYAVRDDMVARFGEAEISNMAAMQSSSTAVDDALQDASEEIDSYVGVKYDLPLPSVPSTLKRVACNIARYRLYFQCPTEEVENRYKAEITYLQQLANGKAVLNILNNQNVVTEEKPKKAPASTPLGTTYQGGVFGNDTLDMMPSIHTHPHRF